MILAVVPILVSLLFFAEAHLLSSVKNRVDVYVPTGSIPISKSYVIFSPGHYQKLCLRFNRKLFAPGYKSFRLFFKSSYNLKRYALEDVKIEKAGGDKIGTECLEYFKNRDENEGKRNKAPVLVVSFKAPKTQYQRDVELGYLLIKRKTKLASFFRLRRPLAVKAKLETKYGAKQIVSFDDQENQCPVSEDGKVENNDTLETCVYCGTNGHYPKLHQIPEALLLMHDCP